MNRFRNYISQCASIERIMVQFRNLTLNTILHELVLGILYGLELGYINIFCEQILMTSYNMIISKLKRK